MIRICRTGFAEDDLAGWQQLTLVAFCTTRLSITTRARTVVYLPNSAKMDEILPCLDYMSAIAIEFPTATDGRGFSLARLIRATGFAGRLRAVGSLLPHQFRHLFSVGFDEYLATEKTATRFPEPLWLEQLEVARLSYQNRISNGSAFNKEKPAISQHQRRNSRIQRRHDRGFGG